MNNCNKSIAQKFILISQQTYNELLNANNTIKQESPSVKEVLLSDSRANESDIAAQLSVAATLNKKNLKQESDQEPREMLANEHLQTNLSGNEVKQIVEELLSAGMSSGKVEKSKTIIKLLQNSDTITVDKQTGRIQSRRGGPQSDSNLFELLINIQHPTKKISHGDLELIKELKIAQHLIANTNAKAVSPKLTRDSNTTWLSMFASKF